MKNTAKIFIIVLAFILMLSSSACAPKDSENKDISADTPTKCTHKYTESIITPVMPLKDGETLKVTDSKMK